MSNQQRFTLRIVKMMNEGENPQTVAAATFSNPGPGIDPIEGEVHQAEYDGDDLVMVVTVDPRDYIRQGIQFGVDPYELLNEFKGQLPSETLTELVEWLKTDNFTVAMINVSSSGLKVE